MIRQSTIWCWLRRPEFGASLDHVEPADKDGIEGIHVDTEIPADEILQDGWSCLKYIEVDVDPSETNYRQGIRQYYLCGS